MTVGIKFEFIYKHKETGEDLFDYWTLDGMLLASLNNRHYELIEQGYKLVGHRQYSGFRDKYREELYYGDIVETKDFGKLVITKNKNHENMFGRNGKMAFKIYKDLAARTTKIGDTYRNPGLEMNNDI